MFDFSSDVFDLVKTSTLTGSEKSKQTIQK